MKFKHRIDDNITARLRQMSDAVSHEVAIEALKEAAEPIRALASALAPRSNQAPHLADNIIVSETTRVRGFGGSGRWRDVDPFVSTVAIGPSYRPEDIFYGQFQEFGTAHHAAQPFLRPAFDVMRSRVPKMIAASLGRAIARRTKGAA